MPTDEQMVDIAVGPLRLPGTLAVSPKSSGVVIFAHGSGSSRLSPRNRYVAQVIQESGTGTLLFDLLSEREDSIYETRFDIELLAERLVAATRWLGRQEETRDMRLGYFGASTGAAAALVAAARLGKKIGALVSRGGRPDLAGEALAAVRCPVLLIVGGADQGVLELNRWALEQLRLRKRLEVVPGATHLFEEPGALERVAEMAARWFRRFLLRSR